MHRIEKKIDRFIHTTFEFSFQYPTRAYAMRYYVQSNGYDPNSADHVTMLSGNIYDRARHWKSTPNKHQYLHLKNKKWKIQKIKRYAVLFRMNGFFNTKSVAAGNNNLNITFLRIN